VAADTLEHTYREEAARLRAALARQIGDLGLAEDLVQDAFVEALEHWPADGIPANPAGWLATTARRKAIDRLRRASTGQEKLALIAAGAAEPGDDDDLLALIFACCHPALPPESQIALTLRTLCGLTTAEIAAAYLVSEPTMAQRLTRARKSLRKAGIRIRRPDPDELGDRLAAVLTVIYLVFNEGYLVSAGQTPTRPDLSAQATWLGRTLHELMPREPEVLGLLALLLLHESRAATRIDGEGHLVQLADQDRSRWNHDLIDEATSLLDRAMAHDQAGSYQLQAAIAAVHATAPSHQRTDWPQIRQLYELLDRLAPSPVVRLNQAVATRFAVGPEQALNEVDALATELASYHLFHAVRGELLAALGRLDEARAANERALARAGNLAERELLTRRLALDADLAKGPSPPSAAGPRS
jgi:RNA polymerase sigma factor (sigma-70 family)